jgi:tetratricopeptide (TPR) repeat protein
MAVSRVRRKVWVVPSILTLLAASLQAWVQPELAEAFSKLRVTEDSVALAAPEQTIVLSLGYRAALADLIYSHLLVDYGAHFQEKRRLALAADTLDTVVELDPTFLEPYLYGDTLITLQPEPPREQDYDRARALQERGTRNLPYEQRVWFIAGQFVGYLAPPRFSDQKKKEEWRLAGARMLARACELASQDAAIPYHCLAAATVLNRAGQREALIEMLQRTLAVNDDPEVREQAMRTLATWGGEQEGERAQLQASRFEHLWRSELGFASKGLTLLVGPSVDAARCAGRYSLAGAGARGCERTWGARLGDLEAQNN